MARNVDRPNPTEYENAQLILGSGETEAQFPAGLAGEYQIFVATYSSDVNVQQRVPAVVDDEGNEVTAATTFRTVKTLGSTDVTFNMRFSKNFEYQLTTATAGSVVYLDVQWDAPS